MAAPMALNSELVDLPRRPAIPTKQWLAKRVLKRFREHALDWASTDDLTASRHSRSGNAASPSLVVL